MAEGGSDNIVTEKEFVTVEFDPYQESTLIRSKDKCEFKYLGTTVSMSIRRHQTGGKDTLYFDFFLRASSSDDYPSWNLVTMDDIAFNCDQEIVCPKETISENSNHGSYQAPYLDDDKLICWIEGSASSIIEANDLRKICDAEKFEIRYYGAAGYSDLSDEEEKQILLICRLFYHESYDHSAYKEHVDVERALRQQGQGDREKSPESSGGKGFLIFAAIAGVIFLILISGS